MNIDDEKEYVATDTNFKILTELYDINPIKLEIQMKHYFLRKYKLQKLTQEELETLNRPRDY